MFSLDKPQHSDPDCADISQQLAQNFILCPIQLATKTNPIKLRLLHSLAQIAAASSCGSDSEHKRYSGKLDKAPKL